MIFYVCKKFIYYYLFCLFPNIFLLISFFIFCCLLKYRFNHAFLVQRIKNLYSFNSLTCACELISEPIDSCDKNKP